MPDILVTARDHVGIVSLNRPEVRNAVTLGMWRELADLFSSLGRDGDVRAIVLPGSGSDFCVAGGCARGVVGTWRWQAIFATRSIRPRSVSLPPDSRSCMAGRVSSACWPS